MTDNRCQPSRGTRKTQKYWQLDPETELPVCGISSLSKERVNLWKRSRSLSSSAINRSNLVEKLSPRLPGTPMEQSSLPVSIISLSTCEQINLQPGSHDGTGRLFTPSGQLQGIMTYGRGAISALKFSPSGHHILTAKTDYTVSLWAVGSSNDQRMLRTFSSHTAEVNDVEWLDDNVFASCGNDKKIFVYRTNDKISRFTFGGHSDDITRLKWQPAREGLAVEDRMLASASDDGTIRLWLLPRYPKDRGTVSRSVSPTKPNEDDEDDNAFDWEENGVNGDKGKRRCVRTLVIVDESENKRMDTVEWSPNGEYIAA